MTDLARARLLKAMHARARERGLDEATRRDLIERVSAGRTRSARDLTMQELVDVIDAMGSRTLKPAANQARQTTPRSQRRPQVAKAVALWRSLYNLGVTRDGSERALDAFVRGQNFGVDALTWADAPALNKIIEALKDWLVRAGGPVEITPEDLEQLNDWRLGALLPPADAGLAAKARLIEAQWQRLAALGVFRTGNQARLDTWLRKVAGVAATQFLSAPAADRIIEDLGAWLRRVAKDKGDE